MSTIGNISSETDIDLAVADGLVRGKNRKFWFERLLSDDGLDLGHYEDRGPSSNWANILYLVGLLRTAGYTICEYEAPCGYGDGIKTIHMRIVAWSQDQASIGRLAHVLLPIGYRDGINTAPGRVDEAVSVIAKNGSAAVELATALATDWQGSLDGFVELVASLA
jgi:hypothetical protein